MRAALAYGVWVVCALYAVFIVGSGKRGRGWRLLALASLGAASTFAFAIVNWGRATPFGDFNKAYYPAGHLVLTDPTKLYECTVSNLCFVNIPIVAVLFVPVGALELGTAQIVFSVVGILSLAVAAWMLVRGVPLHGESRDGFFALLALNGPLFYSARLGNLSHVMLPLVAFALLALARQREWSGGAALAILTVLKPPFLLFAPYLMVRGRWRALLSFGVTIASIVALSIVLFGLELNAVWWRDFAGPFSRLPLTAYNSQSMSSLLARFFYPHNLLDWEPLAGAERLNLVRHLVVAGLVLGVAVVAFLSGSPETELARWYELSIVLVLALLVAPITWTHYYVFCLVPLAAFLATLSDQSTRINLVLATASVLISLPVVLTLPTRPLSRELYERLLVSHYVFGALMLLAVTLYLRWQQREGASPRTVDGGGDCQHYSRTIVKEPGRAARRTTHPEFNVTLQPSP